MSRGGAVIAETIFGLPGLGQFALDGAQGHDIPVIQGVLIVTIVLVLISNLVVDALLAWLRRARRTSSNRACENSRTRRSRHLRSGLFHC